MVGDQGNTNFAGLMRDNNEPLYEGLYKVFEVIIHFEDVPHKIHELNA